MTCVCQSYFDFVGFRIVHCISASTFTSIIASVTLDHFATIALI